MPKRITDSDADAFGKRLVALLEEARRPRRGAGAYLSKKYKVSTVTANAWLNGEYKPNTATAKRIANDHGASFEALYFGDETTKPAPVQPDPVRELRDVLALTVQAMAGSIPDAGQALDEALRARTDLRDSEFVETLLDTLQAELGPRRSRRSQHPAKRAGGANKRR